MATKKLAAQAAPADFVPRAEFESFKKIATIAVAAILEAALACPGTPESKPRLRLEKLAAAADLAPAERAELKSLYKGLDALRKVEARREFAEAQARSRPPTFDSIRPMNWRG